MTGRIVAFVLVGLLGLLSIQEVVRFNRAGRDPEALHYPRRRLIRRLTVGVLFIAILTLTAFWPDAATLRVRGALTIVLLIAFCGSFLLLFRDLTEVSREVVAMSSEIDRRTTRELERAMAEERAKRAKAAKAEAIADAGAGEVAENDSPDEKQF